MNFFFKLFFSTNIFSIFRLFPKSFPACWQLLHDTHSLGYFLPIDATKFIIISIHSPETSNFHDAKREENSREFPMNLRSIDKQNFSIFQISHQLDDVPLCFSPESQNIVKQDNFSYVWLFLTRLTSESGMMCTYLHSKCECSACFIGISRFYDLSCSIKNCSKTKVYRKWFEWREKTDTKMETWCFFWKDLFKSDAIKKKKGFFLKDEKNRIFRKYKKKLF